MSSGGGSGSSNSASSSGTQVTRTDPWPGQVPYLTDVFARAQALGNTPMSFPAQTFAPPSDDTLLAQSLQRQRALAGSPLNRANSALLTGTLGGQFLSSGNPYFRDMFNQAADAAQSRLTGQFEGMGRYGSGAYAGALSSALANTAGQLAYQNYGDERQNQLRASLLAPSMAQQDYGDIARLGEVGAAEDDLAQQAVNDAVNRLNFAQEEPWQRLARYAAMIQGNYGNTSTTTFAGDRRSIGVNNNFDLGLGGTLGAAAGSAFGQPGLGALLGTALGGLL